MMFYLLHDINSTAPISVMSQLFDSAFNLRYGVCMKQIDYSPLTRPISMRQALVYDMTIMTVRNKRFLYMIGISFIVLFIILISMTVVPSLTNGGINIAPLVLLLLVALAVLIAVSIVAGKAKLSQRVRKFAEVNGFVSLSNVSYPGYSGAIFNQAHTRRITFAVIVPSETEREVEYGEYQYTDGYGRYAHVYQYGYIKIKLTRRLPHIMIHSKGNSPNHHFFSSQKMQLEGDFNDYFNVYVPTGYERDALYILKPDLMASLIDNAKEYDIEIIDDELFIYKYGTWYLATPGVLGDLQSLTERIMKEVNEETVRYVDTRVENHTSNIIAEPGQRLKRHNLSWLTVLGLSLGAIISYFMIISRTN